MSSYTIVCNSCGTANRIPVDKEGKTGRCGNCRAALAPLCCHPQNLTEGSFDPFVNRYPGTILAVFWAPW
jgi:thioredoxin 2